MQLQKTLLPLAIAICLSPAFAQKEKKISPPPPPPPKVKQIPPPPPPAKVAPEAPEPPPPPPPTPKKYKANKRMAPKAKIQKFTPPKIVKDEEVKSEN